MLTALDRAGVVVPADAQRAVNPFHHLPHSQEEAAITAFVEDIAELDAPLERFKGWRLRMHYNTPAPQPPRRDLLAEIDALHARLGRLEGC